MPDIFIRHKSNKYYYNDFLTLLLHDTKFYTEKPSENIVGKGENAGNQHFLLFLTMFSTFRRAKSIFSATYISSSANAFNLELSKILSFGKNLNIRLHTRFQSDLTHFFLIYEIILFLVSLCQILPLTVARLHSMR